MNSLKMFNEIQKMMFDKNHFARFLAANNFDTKKAITHVQEYLDWRKQTSVDVLLVTDLQFIVRTQSSLK